MKIDEITPRWKDIGWDFLQGVRQGLRDPKGYKAMGKNVKGSEDDYLQRQLQALRQLGQDIDNLKINPAEIHPATWQAIDNAVGRPYNPADWAKRQEKYQQAQPQQSQPQQQSPKLGGLSPDDPNYQVLSQALARQQQKNKPIA